MGHPRLVIASAFVAVTGCGLLLPGEEAPDACGFPEGTALSYAGRSTTAALDVQEVVGDPLSDEPADIYITRDKFDQGELHGRLVCAVFVDQQGFVEITVHPADGGRFVPDPVPTAAQPSDGISEDEALQAAREVVPDPEEWELVYATAGPLGRVEPAWESYPWAEDLSPDLWVWRVFLVRGDMGAIVIMDFADGSVHGILDVIVD